MALTNAERQLKFQRGALQDPDGSLRVRVQVLVSAQAAGALDRASAASGRTKAEIIEELLLSLEPNVTA